MPDDRDVERYVERFLESFDALTKQFGRLAYAKEQEVIQSVASDIEFVEPCKACGCRLLTEVTDVCPACQTYIGGR